MKKSINTFLKHPTKDNDNRSANPPVTRASTILFNTMQEMISHEKKIKFHKNITWGYMGPRVFSRKIIYIAYFNCYHFAINRGGT